LGVDVGVDVLELVRECGGWRTGGGWTTGTDVSEGTAIKPLGVCR